MTDFTLLPTQQALLDRLNFNANYGKQLQILVGDTGTGKTTLVSTLNVALNEYDSALVICPQHADCAEIRRKILVQLIPALLFDDELPLPDTLVAVQAQIKRPLHIIIDDAHLLPLELWVECLILSQLNFAGRSVAVTFTSLPQFVAELKQHLSASQQGLIYIINIEFLPLFERERLYQNLLSNLEHPVLISRKKLSNQLTRIKGTPQAVKNFLQTQQEAPRSKYRKKWLIPVCIGLFFIGSVLLWDNDKKEADTSSPEQLVLSVNQ